MVHMDHETILLEECIDGGSATSCRMTLDRVGMECTKTVG